MIEKVQKQVLFEEAAKKGIISSRLLQVPEILRNILGPTDIGTFRYGGPLASVYIAKSGELIEIPRISNFFTGLARDIRVTDIALTNIEDDLLLFNLEIWTRMQLLKNRAQDLSKKARVEKIRASLGATWVYTETFSNTRLIDMQQTTAWIDAAEGIAFIPNSGDEKTIPMQQISVADVSLSNLNSFLNSNPKQAFDGLDNTNWRCLFVENNWVSATYKLESKSDVTAISIDPVGFGIELIVETWKDNSFSEAIKAIIYSKTTFPIYKDSITQIKISFRPATSVLPKVVGIREIVLFQTISTKYAEIISKQLKPNEPFTEIKLTPKGQFPQGTITNTFFRTATGDPWIQLNTEDWYPVHPTDSSSLSLHFTDSVDQTASQGFRGLYARGINSSEVPTTNFEGNMSIGLNMVEVTCFKKDWAEEGEIPKLLTPQDFQQAGLRRTWSKVPSRSFIDDASGTVLQPYGNSSIKGEDSLRKDGAYMLFQRRLDDSYPAEMCTYNQLCVVPLVGHSASGMMQYEHNYRLSCMVYVPKAFSFQEAKYWFYQGYRKTDRRLYRSLGKSFGTFVLYVNDTLVVGEEVGKTISVDNKVEGLDNSIIDLGTSFSLNFNEGWNKVEILMNVFNPDKYGQDDFDVTNAPYLQLSIYPSIFDPEFYQAQNSYISKIIASGVYKPVNQFDLLWNLPKEPVFWAWSDDRKYVLFNTNELKSIDGYYSGSAPTSIIDYKSIQADSVDDLFLKLSLQREDTSKVSPILSEYNVMVR